MNSDIYGETICGIVFVCVTGRKCGRELENYANKRPDFVLNKLIIELIKPGSNHEILKISRMRTILIRDYIFAALKFYNKNLIVNNSSYIQKNF